MDFRYKIELMPNARIFVQDRRSGLSGAWDYKKSGNKIIIGKNASGDLSRAVNFDRKSLAELLKRNYPEKEVILESNFNEWLKIREHADAGSSDLASMDAMSSTTQMMPSSESSPGCCACDFQNWISKKKKKKST